MKNCGIISLAAALVLGFVATASADPPRAVDASSLAGMGLGGMRVMSDDEGTAVRGMGVFANGDFGSYGMKSIGHKKNDYGRNLGHKKMDHRSIGHKKLVHGKSFGHKSFGHKTIRHDFGHKSIGHKGGGGMIWQPKTMVWNVGGKPTLW